MFSITSSSIPLCLCLFWQNAHSLYKRWWWRLGDARTVSGVCVCARGGCAQYAVRLFWPHCMIISTPEKAKDHCSCCVFNFNPHWIQCLKRTLVVRTCMIDVQTMGSLLYIGLRTTKLTRTRQPLQHWCLVLPSLYSECYCPLGTRLKHTHTRAYRG